MQIVIDSGIDLPLTPDEIRELKINVVPLLVTLGRQTYRDHDSIDPAAFYPLLAEKKAFAATSQPNLGDFCNTYRCLAAVDPDILSLHMSSGLSGAFRTAQTAAAMVPEARVTVIDTRTLSVAAGWQVEAAARAVRAGWLVERIVALLDRIRAASDTLFTLDELKYLIRGGRISHMKGLLAATLDLKPLIGVEKSMGTYIQRGKVRSFPRALEGLVDLIARQHAPGSRLRVQIAHALNPEGAARLREIIGSRFDCTWLPVKTLSMVLGAHTGPSMVGIAYAPASAFEYD
jgi:DegV family protein with EDD domain